MVNTEKKNRRFCNTGDILEIRVQGDDRFRGCDMMKCRGYYKSHRMHYIMEFFDYEDEIQNLKERTRNPSLWRSILTQDFSRKDLDDLASEGTIGPAPDDKVAKLLLLGF